jgi:hypothetical protein
MTQGLTSTTPYTHTHIHTFGEATHVAPTLKLPGSLRKNSQSPKNCRRSPSVKAGSALSVPVQPAPPSSLSLCFPDWTVVSMLMLTLQDCGEDWGK